MRAALILALDRVSRLAIAASSTRKARAISSVVSPPSRRRVSATWASRARAGWQQVKISRSRSSATPLTPSAALDPAQPGGVLGGGVEQGGLGVPQVAGRLPSQPVDGAVAGGRGQPGPRVRGQPGGGPPPDGLDVGLLGRVLGDVDVAEPAYQTGDHAPVLLTEDLLEGRVEGPGGQGWSGGLRHRPGKDAPRPGRRRRPSLAGRGPPRRRGRRRRRPRTHRGAPWPRRTGRRS